MTQINRLEQRAFQFFILILAVICFVPGGASAFGGMNASAVLGGGVPLFEAGDTLSGFADNQYRFGFGVFFAQGLVLLYFLRNIYQRASLFRVVSLGLFIGGVARLSNIIEFGLIDSQVVGPTVIELAIVPMLIIWHQRLLSMQLSIQLSHSSADN